MTQTANTLGTQKITTLLVKQAIPASIGILVMSLNMIVDTIFVGQWIGSMAIAAITWRRMKNQRLIRLEKY